MEHVRGGPSHPQEVNLLIVPAFGRRLGQVDGDRHAFVRDERLVGGHVVDRPVLVFDRVPT